MFFLYVQVTFAEQNPLPVLATTNILFDTLNALGKESLNISLLMKAGIDPHTYKASARDYQKINDAKFIFYNGFHLEAALSKIFHQLEDKAMAVAEHLPREKLIDDNGIIDPHIWMDVSLWRHAAKKIYEQLTTLLPHKTTLLKENFIEYDSKLYNLEQWVVKRIKELPMAKRKLVTAHDAFRYFGKAYEFEVYGVQGISTATETSIKKIRVLSSLIIENKIKAIFVETSVSQHSILALREAVEVQEQKIIIGPPLFSDSLDIRGKPAGTYIGMIKYNVDGIVNSLK